MKKSAGIFLLVLFGLLAWPLWCSAQDHEKLLTEAKELYAEIEALRSKMEEEMNALVAIQEEFQAADQEKQQELESQGMLKQRSFERMSSTLQVKNAKLFDLTSTLIAGDPKNAGYRAMRYKAC